MATNLWVTPPSLPSPPPCPPPPGLPLQDKDQGEFCYEIVGDTALPAPVQEMKGSVPLEGPCSYDLLLPFANPQLDLARRLFQVTPRAVLHCTVITKQICP